MIKLLKSRLKMLIWFTVGLMCVLLVAIGLPLIQSASMVTSSNDRGSVHAYTPTNKPGISYWSVGVTRDANHLPDL